MRLKHSLFSRRQFLNGMLGGWLGALLASLLYPILKFIFPPYWEPDEVVLVYADYADMEPNSFRVFAWGNKPGILKKNTDGTLLGFVAVCTHLDCNVTYMPEQKKFFCACHEGWYDEYGTNIGGPPSQPLRRLFVVMEEDNLIIRKDSPE